MTDIIEQITQVANAIAKKEGYVTTVKIWDTKLVVMAIMMLNKEAEKLHTTKQGVM